MTPTTSVQVTPGLVAKLGAVRAIVWARIDLESWWKADLDTIAAETGLSRDQAKRAVLGLERAGHIESRQDRGRDRTKSYRTVHSAGVGSPLHGGTSEEDAQIPSGWQRDKRLSLKARGLLAELMTHEPGWTITVESIVKGSREGRTAVYAAVRELLGVGYLVRTQDREEGQFRSVAYELSWPGQPISAREDTN